MYEANAEIISEITKIIKIESKFIRLVIGLKSKYPMEKFQLNTVSKKFNFFNIKN